MFLKAKLTDIVHELLKSRINMGDTVIDATAGNGFDTIFLAKAVGEKGRVISFDIQKKAIYNTKDLLMQEGLLDRVKLIQDSHSNIDKYVTNPIAGAMFNLGYLPKGDGEVITKAHSTLKALEKASSLLMPGGVISVISYWGHPGGLEEKEAVENFLSKLESEKFITAKFNYLNRGGYPPIIYFLERI
ncbi:MAG: methyltransferase domain-containing protein [Epulopiscium sp.]|nr:methyltransferase domain-containing protein [Candidatus Epulonipiscium sp.]